MYRPGGFRWSPDRDRRMHVRHRWRLSLCVCRCDCLQLRWLRQWCCRAAPGVEDFACPQFACPQMDFAKGSPRRLIWWVISFLRESDRSGLRCRYAYNGAKEGQMRASSVLRRLDAGRRWQRVGSRARHGRPPVRRRRESRLFVPSRFGRVLQSSRGAVVERCSSALPATSSGLRSGALTESSAVVIHQRNSEERYAYESGSAFASGAAAAAWQST